MSSSLSVGHHSTAAMCVVKKYDSSADRPTQVNLKFNSFKEMWQDVVVRKIMEVIKANKGDRPITIHNLS